MKLSKKNIPRRAFAALLTAALCLVFLPAKAQTVITLSFVGDCTLGGDESWMNMRHTFMHTVAEHGMAYPFAKVRHLLEADDVTVANLEGVLQDTATGRQRALKYNFRGPTAYTQILTLGSVEAVSLGNNHSGDYGEQGLASTKTALTAAGIGFFIDEEVFIFEKDGVRIALMGFHGRRYTALQDTIPGTIARLRSEGCQAVIVSLHFGKQYVARHNSQQTELAHHAIDSGADLVVGHHPHVVQGIEIYKQRLILYSLGNFAYGGNRQPRTIEFPSVVAQVAMAFDERGFVSQTLTLHPVHISGTRPRNNYQPYPVFGADAQAVINQIQGDTPFPLNPYVEGLGAMQETVYAYPKEK
ncbi:MAG: CapA family protein [Clostridia bacterium]|nr:CapA family protein [Clostridia bacterium]